jgi:hypothetical protein
VRLVLEKRCVCNPRFTTYRPTQVLFGYKFLIRSDQKLVKNEAGGATGAGLFFDEAAFAEVGVEAAALEELFVAAAFEDAASIEDENLVGVADG